MYIMWIDCCCSINRFRILSPLSPLLKIWIKTNQKPQNKNLSLFFQHFYFLFLENWGNNHFRFGIKNGGGGGGGEKPDILIWSRLNRDLRRWKWQRILAVACDADDDAADPEPVHWTVGQLGVSNDNLRLGRHWRGAKWKRCRDEGRREWNFARF